MDMKVIQREMWFDEEDKLPLPSRPLFVDCFAGGGGASTGIRQALKRDVDIAINHDRDAISMHKSNHPSVTRHYCEDVWHVDPVLACEGRKVSGAWFSPDCRHFSKAKGGTPVKKKIRGLAWSAVIWAEKKRPNVLWLENVEEFLSWGPVCRKTGQPIKEKAGITFDLFVWKLEQLGYKVEWKLLVASDFGAPTSRRRLFMVARCDGKPIIWPEPTHGSPKAVRARLDEIRIQLKEHRVCNLKPLKPWNTAAGIIDWSIPCPSIFASSAEIKEQYGVRAIRPLKDKTLKRIAEGVKRFVIETDNPFIVGDQGHFVTSSAYTKSTGRGRYVYPMDDPIRTLTASNDKVLIGTKLAPFISRYYGTSIGSSITDPVGTATKFNHTAVVTPYIAALQHGGSLRRIDQPIHTITASRKDCNLVVAPKIAPFMTSAAHGGGLNRVHNVHEPTRTLTGKNDKVLVAPSLISYYGPRPGDNGHRGRSIENPIPTQTTENRFAVVSAFIAKHFGGMTGIEANRPFPTITARGTQNQLAAVTMVQSGYGERQGQAPRCLDINKPLGTVVGTNKFAEVRAFLFKYYGSGGQWGSLDRPLATITVKDRLALGIVMVGDQPYQIIDIGMRMLSPRELFRAQGFPDDYEIEKGYEGKPVTKTDQVARCGNSVPPHMAEALVRANLEKA